MNETIRIKGARVNNLKNINLEIPLGKFIVITGLSGSGKSSLAFDTLYAEGQRRYVESLSAYARQFLGRMNKPDCDTIKGLPPAIAIEQKVTARNPRSTVGTSTEIYDYLRMLYARIGHTYSPISGVEVKKDTVESVIECALTYSEGTRFTLLSPVRIHHDRSLQEQLEVYLKQGVARLDAEGEMVRIDDVLEQEDKKKKVEESFQRQQLFLLIDRLVVKKDKDFMSRMADSVETAFYEGDGECMLRIYPANSLHKFSTRFEADGMSFNEPTDQMFSFNSPAGACEECEGFGKVVGIDEKLVIPDTSLSVMEGAVMCWRGEKMGEWKNEFVRRNGAKGFPIFTPYYELTKEQKEILWHGDKEEQQRAKNEQVSIDSFFRMVKENQYKIQYRVMLARYSGKTICPRCHGSRLKAEAEYVRINGRSITELVRMPISKLRDFFSHLTLSDNDAQIGKRLLMEVRSRLGFLCDVGLSYLTLDRLSNSLSGGESQRINLAKSLGSSLVGSLYILDEPSIGLHSRDTDQLIGVLLQLRNLGNTVIVVEHDEDIMKAADYLIDIGPGAGRLGGEVVYAGENKCNTSSSPLTVEERSKILSTTQSHTVRYLLHESKIAVPSSRRKWTHSIEIRGARENNLKDINVTFPLNVMTAVTGVSGSGKSTLVHSILYNALKRHMGEASDAAGEHTALGGDLEAIKSVEFINQNPIGKSSRSNPVTYIKAYDEIRKLMAQQPLSQQLNFTPAFFSFNTDGGRCEECKGEGTVKVEMQFMADLTLECEACHGQRFKKEVLEVRFEGKNIYDILNLTVNQAIEFFSEHHCDKIAANLQPLQDVGLGYIRLGQSSSTLSGGENQRVKLAYYLAQEHVEPTLFIFDEPTTGLHFHDIRKLLKAFDALIERGHTIITIEHNLDVVKMADYVIDLGPEGGNEGGYLVMEGTPEQVAATTKGYTGKYLKEKLEED